jgi:hypothetical protein
MMQLSTQKKQLMEHLWTLESIHAIYLKCVSKTKTRNNNRGKLY